VAQYLAVCTTKLDHLFSAVIAVNFSTEDLQNDLSIVKGPEKIRASWLTMRNGDDIIKNVAEPWCSG
jgi:hypothetical protein